ncbi:MAG: TonB-dependent receptor [Bacteroidales bacterium]|nr:TonB-dependent receptor [Bacteroidales bacterium]
MNNTFFKLVKLFFLISLFFSFNLEGYSQKKISGTVMDGGENLPVIGANILVKGKTSGTVTDIDGKYSIIASPSDVLIFSYIGLQKQEVTVGDRTTINVTLKPIVNELSEVVAIGYGTVKKSDLTGSVSVVTVKDLTKNPSPSAAQALQGKAPGVLVTQSGAPGGDANIRVRGVGSISKGADPIFIVDGIKVSNINGIQPQEIESMQVLKDASAAAIYGADGSNGVIIITTVRGKSGKTQVSFNTFGTFNLAPKQYDMMNADEYSNFLASTKYKAYGLGKTYLDIVDNKVKVNPGYALTPEFRQSYYGTGWEHGTNWQDYAFKNGFNQSYNLSISGGGESNNFSVSGGYTKEDGTIIKNSMERFRLRANSDFILSKYIKIGENISLNKSIEELPLTVQSSLYDLSVSPLMKVYNPFLKGGYESFQEGYYLKANGETTRNALEGTDVNGDGQVDLFTNTLSNDKANPICAPSLGSYRKFGFGTSASAYAQIDFTNWLQYKFTPSIDMASSRTKSWLPAFDDNRGSGNAELKEKYTDYFGYTVENQLSFKKIFNKTHNVQATFVHSIKSTSSNEISGAANGFNYEVLNTLTNGGTASTSLKGTTSDYKMLSYLGRVIYDYKSKYFVTASYRSDGVSIFAPKYRRGSFYSGSLAWKINEDFFKDIKEIDIMKVRVGWGQTGNSDIGGGFQYLDKISESIWFSPVFGTNQTIANAQYSYMEFPSKEIHWETAQMLNIGFDLNMFKNRLITSVEYYVKDNRDLLIQMPISYTFGYNTGKNAGKPWVNAGKIQNKGVEISLQWRDQVNKDFSYGINSNFTTIMNDVTYLPVPYIIGKSNSLNVNETNRTTVGQSIGALYGYMAQGIIQLTDEYYAKDGSGSFVKDAAGNYIGYKFGNQEGAIPQPGDIRYEDLNADGIVDSKDKTILGKTIPSFTYTLGFDCSYKNFDFSLFLNGISGFDIFNAQRASLSSLNAQDAAHNKLRDYGLNYWTVDRPSTEYVRADPANTNKNDQISSFWIEDGSFLRIKDIQMGYTLPSKTTAKIGIKSLRAYINASNVYNFTKYKGRDPESFISDEPLVSGIDLGSYVLPRSFTVGFQVSF